MNDTHYNPFSFLSTDIVVWNGIISSYGSIAPLVKEGDEFRIASENEESAHKKFN